MELKEKAVRPFGWVATLYMPAKSIQEDLISQEKVVIPDERSDPAAGGTRPFKLQIPWIPDRVRDDGKK